MISFRFKATGTSLPRYSRAQFYNKARITYSPRAAPAQVRRSSAVTAVKRRSFRRHTVLTPTRSHALNVVRCKPTLPSGAQNASFWSMRGYPFWHRRGCTWVHSVGDPRRAQRDKDCPACQEHAKMPVELSQRELMWQRQLQFMKEWIDRDPYDAMFGWSNDLRKGNPIRNHKFLRQLGIDGFLRNDHFGKSMSSAEPTWRRGASQPLSQKETAEGSPNSTDPIIGKPANEKDPIMQNTSKESAHSQESSIRGWGHWKLSSTDPSGRVIEQSGDMIYDPITMRMIPTKQTSEVAGTKDKTSTLSKSNQAENIPIKKSDDIQIDRETPAKQSETAAQNVTAGDEAIPLESPPLGVTISERRLDLIRRAEHAMTQAQSQLEALSVTLDTAQKRPAMTTELTNTIKSLQRTHSAFKSLKRDELVDRADMESSVSVNLEQQNSGMPTKEKQKDSSPIKVALENSWAKEASNRKQSETMDISTSSAHSPSALPHESKIGSKVSSVDHMASLASKRTNPVLRRERALKHMTAFEIGTHRAALLKAWAQKRRQNQELTPAERKLNEEVRVQKDAMAAYENRPKFSSISNTGKGTTAGEASPRLVDPTNAVTAEGDLSPNASKFASTERWYKKKAPHALMKEQERLQDRALVAEIKAIYEEAYGLINETHSQGKVAQELKSSKEDQEELTNSTVATTDRTETPTPKKATQSPNPQKPQPPSQPATYQVLAYDRKTGSVHTASASASFSPPTGDKVLPFTDALERLHHPAKFLPFISQLNADGYEMVSASKHLLVFKKTATSSVIDNLAVNELKSVTQESKQAEAEARLDALINEYAGGRLAPGAQSHSKASARPAPSAIPSATNPRIRKEEAVFTGRPLKEPSGSDGASGREYYSRRKRNRLASSRIFLFIGQLAVAASCVYLLGCLIEELYASTSAEEQLPAELADEEASPLAETQKPAVISDETANRTTDATPAARPGFWAAVNKEQARRAEARRLEAVRKADEERRKVRSLGMGLDASYVTTAAVDVALFSTALWIVMKLLDRSL